jgi:hypothetical protein
MTSAARGLFETVVSNNGTEMTRLAVLRYCKNPLGRI